MASPNHESTSTVVCPGCGGRHEVPASAAGGPLSCSGCGSAVPLDGDSSSRRVSATGTAPSVPGAHGGEDRCLVLGKLALKHRFLSDKQLREAISVQQEERRGGKRSLLGSVLLRMGMITQKQLDFLLSVQMMIETRGLDRKFGVIAVENGFVESAEVEAALEEQERLFKESRAIRLIGEILVEKGKMEAGHRDAVLVRQERLTSEDKSRSAPPESTPGTRSAEQPSHPLDQALRVSLSPDGSQASIASFDSIPEDTFVEDLKTFLAKHEVTHGLMPDDELKAFLEGDSASGRPFVVARSTPPQPGQDAEIIYHFDTDPLKVGTIKDGGNIDFKDKGELPQVSKGDLLAERIPPKEGVPGIDVRGRPVPPPRQKDRRLRKAKGTVLSEDGLSLFADNSGRPEMSADGKVFVFSQHKISGDVDLKTGHVEFEGDIHVSGTVQKGFIVRGGSLTANEIAGGEIAVRGDLTVTGGIIGADIQSGGNLRARYLNKARVRSFGDVVLEREVIDSEVETSGAFILKSGPVYSSKIIAKKGIQAAQVGSETANPSILVVGTDDRVKNEIISIKDRINKIVLDCKQKQNEIDVINNQKQLINVEIGKEVQQLDALNVKKRQLEEKAEEAIKADDKVLQEKIKAAIKTLETELMERDKSLDVNFSEEEALNEKVAELKDQILSVESGIEKLKKEIQYVEEWSISEEAIPLIKISGKLYSGTVIKGRHTMLNMPETHTGLQIKETYYEDPEDGKPWKLRISKLKK